MPNQDSSGESVEITWPLDETTMYGALARPAGAGPFPAVVMVAGSGPTNRDWNSPLLPGSNGSARLIAEALAAAGFVSLRYDKRASGSACAREYAVADRQDEHAEPPRRTGERHQDVSRADVRPRRYDLRTWQQRGNTTCPELPDSPSRDTTGGPCPVAPPGRSVGAVARPNWPRKPLASQMGRSCWGFTTRPSRVSWRASR